MAPARPAPPASSPRWHLSVREQRFMKAMADMDQGLPASAYEHATQTGTYADWEQLQSDVSKNCEDRGERQGHQQTEVSCVQCGPDEEVGGSSLQQVALRAEVERRPAQEEQVADMDESARNLLNIECFLEITLTLMPAETRRFIAFVLRPLMILLCLMVTREWRSSLSPLTGLKAPMLTLITYLVDVEMTVHIDGITEDMRDVTEAMVFVLLVLLRLLFSVWQFFKCQRSVKMMWDRSLTLAYFDAFGDSKYLACLPHTLPDVYGSKTCTGLPWGFKSSGYFSDDLLRTCGRVYDFLCSQKQGVFNQMQRKYGPHTTAFFVENSFSAFVWMCVLYVVVLVTITVLMMILEAVTDVLTLCTSYTIDWSTGGAARSKALQDAVKQCLMDKDCTLLDRAKWCLHQLTSRNRGYGAAGEATRAGRAE